MHKVMLLTYLLSLVGTRFVLASPYSETSDVDLGNLDAGLSLLQVGSKRTWPWPPPRSSPEAQTANDKSSDNRSWSWPPGPSSYEARAARDILPRHLFKLGLKVLRTEENLDRLVTRTRVQTQQLVAEQVTFRIQTHDGVDGVDGYDLGMLRQLAANRSGMVNMMDIGGNLGRVTITAFKKAPKQMRIVVVEPVPTTYFLLRWNLWLNKIPILTLSEFQSSPTKAGVLALENAITGEDAQKVALCGAPPQSMRARTCQCSADDELVDNKICVEGRTMDYLLNLFGNRTIDLLKMDCEGCEYHAVPALVKHMEASGQKVHRFAAELHEQGNKLEDMACKFDGGRFMWHVCHMKSGWKDWYATQEVSARCKLGPTRESCLRTAHGVPSQ